MPGRCCWIAALLTAVLLGQVPQPAAPMPATTGSDQPSSFLAIDTAAFAWRPGEEEQQLLAVRRLCGLGDYEAAAALLPADTQVPEARAAFVRRERARIQALLALRATVLEDLKAKQGSLLVHVDGKDVRGRFVRSDADSVVLRVDKDERSVPIEALGPEVLLREGNRLKCFEGDARWMEGWLRWLCGHKLAQLRGLFDLGHPALRELEHDLPTDFDDPQGKAVGALIALQRLQVGADAAAARKSLDMLLGITKAQGRSSLLQTRKAAIEQLARALAERAFVCGEPASLGITGKTETLRDGRVRVRYADPRACPTADFAPRPPDKSGRDPDLPPKLDYQGPTQLRAATGCWELIGSGNFGWPVRLSGKQEIEVEFELTGTVYFELRLCSEDSGVIRVTLDGTATIVDRASGLNDRVGKPVEILSGQRHKVTITHDGSRHVAVAVDGKTTADLPFVGNVQHGNVDLWVHSNNVIKFYTFTMTGRLEPDVPALREQFVAATMARLWG